MNATQKKPPPEELRMSSAEFDRIMRRALQIKPKDDKKPKGKPKARKKTR